MNKTEDKNLTQLVIDTRDGVDGAFEKLYEETIRFSYGTACVLLKNKEDIEDVLQNSYMYVARYIKDLKNPESFMSWLGTIVRHECGKHLAKQKKAGDIFGGLIKEKEEEVPEEDIPYNLIEKNEISDAVGRIVEKLPDDKRACIVLFYFEQKSVSEISEILGIPEGTVKSRLHSARKILEKEFNKLKKENEILYGVSVIPLVAAFFAFQVKNITVPVAVAEGTAVFTAIAEGTAVTTTVSAASAVGGTAAGGAASVSGAAGTAAAGVTTKIAAVAVAAAVATGGTAATVSYVSNQNETTTVISQTTVTEEYTTAMQIFIEETTEMITTEAATTPTASKTKKETTSAVTEHSSTVYTTSETTQTTAKETTTRKRTTRKQTTAPETTLVTTTVQETTEAETTELTTEEETTTQKYVTTTNDVITTALTDIYNVSGGVLEEYTGEGGGVTIPSSVGGDTVTAIGTGAFAGNSDITSVSLPTTVTRIGQEAFSDCTGLKNVYLPSSLASIGIGAFYGCTSLTSVNIPSGVTTISDDAFADCSSLTSVTVPESVTSIGDNAFGGCDNLTIKCPENSAAHNYAVENSIEYELI